MRRHIWSAGAATVLVAGAAVVAVLVVVALNVSVFHGFAPTCADGHPEWDAAACGVQFAEAGPYVAGIGIVAAVMALAGWALIVASRPAWRQ